MQNITIKTNDMATTYAREGYEVTICHIGDMFSGWYSIAHDEYTHHSDNTSMQPSLGRVLCGLLSLAMDDDELAHDLNKMDALIGDIYMLGC